MPPPQKRRRPQLTDAQIARARKGPQKETGGNSKPDQAWIEEVKEELHEPNEAERPEDFHYNVEWQWEYSVEDLNVEFFESFARPGARRCTGNAYVRDQRGGYIIDRDWNRLTRPCLLAPAVGTVVCRKHGAEVPRVKEAAERTLAHAAEVVAIRLVGLTGTVDELNQAIDHKIRLAAANSVLDRVGIKAGTTVEVQLPGYKKVLSDMFSEDDDNAED